jgi:hypothetical protein
VKVRKLYIIIFDPDAELRSSGRALREKYCPKVIQKGGTADDVVLIEADGYFGEHKFSVVAGRHTPPVIEQDLGIYLLAHATADGGILGLPDGGAKIITDLQISSVRKLCYVACALAKKVEWDENPAVKKCVLEVYCKDLHEVGLDPAMAGWDAFVSVCAEGNPAQWTESEGEEQRTTSEKNNPANYGRKIQGLNKKFADNTERQKHRKMFQWVQESGGPARLTNTNWHDA